MQKEPDIRSRQVMSEVTEKMPANIYIVLVFVGNMLESDESITQQKYF